MSRTKKIIAAVLVGVAALTLSACNDDATVASDNLSKAADNFEVQRRIVFFNGITDTYLLEIVGLCSIVDEGSQLEVTCKVGDGEYKKHFLGLSDNVSYFVEQVEAERVSDTYYRVTFKPQSILPDIDIRGSQTLPESQG
jgi:predicted small secreted protein